MARSTARRLAPGFRSFSQHLLEHGHVEHLFSQHLLQLCILGFERLQPPGLRHFHAAILRAPSVERAIADAVLPAELLGAYPGLVLLQDAPS